MDKTCYNCGAPIAKAYCEGWPEVCEHWKPKKPPTNADRIRAMSDEELAEFIGGIYTLERDAWGDYDPCVVVEQSMKIRDKEDMLDWLQSPAGGD